MAERRAPIVLARYQESLSAPPLNLPDAAERYRQPGFSGVWECRLRPVGRLFALERGYLADARLRLLPEARNPRDSRPVGRHVLLKMLAAAPRPRLWREAIWLANTSTKAIYHWIAETLPKLHLLHERQTALPVILPGRLRRSALVSGSLELLPNLRFDWLDGGRLGIIGQGWLVDETAPTAPDRMAHNGPVLLDMAASFRRRLGVEAAPRERIYVSRQDSARRIADAGEVEALLAARGFRSVHLERLGFADQVRVMAGARAVVSTHGAGLANIIFAPPGADIIELTNPGYHFNFHHLATSLGHRSWAVDTDPLPAHGDRPIIHRDQLVDAGRLEACLDAAGLGPAPGR